MLVSNPFFRIIAAALVAIFVCCTNSFVWAEEQDDSAKSKDYFAIINNQQISTSEFIYRFQKAVKEKFFHGRVSDKELEEFKKQVTEQLVSEVLLEQEARKRGMQPDAAKVKQKLENLDSKFSGSESKKERESWEQNRDKVLAVMKNRFERDLLVEQLQDEVKQSQQPTAAEVKRYYEENQKKFTEPPRWDVSIILLSVDPSSSPEIWDETVEKADELLNKIRHGESFEELARIHSGDETAPEGGHMGYIHLGMLGTPAQKVLNVMEPGEISEPVVLLEGVAIFRLNGVREEDLNSLEDVEERARNLLKREQGKKAWEALLLQVRKSADIEYGDLINKTIKIASPSEQ